MNLRRPIARGAVAALLLAGVAGSSAPLVAAGTPDTTPDTTPSSSEPVDGATDPAEAEQPQGQVEIVQSWTLTPGGGSDGEGASTRPDLTYQIAPGTVLEDTVVVYNLGNVPMTFRVYATDAFNNDDGQFDLLPGADVPTDAGSWVKLDANDITLPVGKQATIPFTLTVPVDATPGDHVGAIVAASIATTDNGDGTVVDVERRTGTRLYVQVDGPLEPKLAVTDLEMTYHHSANPMGGSADVTFTVENQGNVRLGGTPVVSVSGPFGIGSKEITLEGVPEILPGQEIPYTTTLEGVPALFLDTTEVRLDASDPAERSDVEDVVTSARSFVPPITVLLVLLLVAFVVLARRAYERRRKAAIPVAPIASRAGARSNDLEPEREPQHQ